MSFEESIKAVREYIEKLSKHIDEISNADEKNIAVNNLMTAYSVLEGLKKQAAQEV